MPARYCPECLTLARPRATHCQNCRAPRPDSGWPATRPNRYPWLGEQLDDRYRLVQYVGFGSTGEVYRAIQTRVKRSFAAKVIDKRALPRSVDFEELTERLRREVAVLGQVRTPHVVPIVDFLQEDVDLFVLIMDLALGVTLERTIFDQKSIPVLRTLEISEQILDALGDIHDRGVVHRGLKPENIVIQTLRSGRPFVRLLDFGVAKVKDEPSLTRGFVGTPLFSAPEQIRNAEDVDERCDLYAFGCIFYNMLAGAPPYVGTRSVEVMEKHLTAEIPPLPRSTGDIRLDELFNDFLQRALAKNPEDRFQSAAEMLSSPIFDVHRLRRDTTQPLAPTAHEYEPAFESSMGLCRSGDRAASTGARVR